MTERIWHDPIGRDGPCPECNEPWPCAERTRQREDMKWIRKLLDEALYAATRPRPSIDGREAVRYQSPLGWWADITYGEHGVLMVVHTPTGDVRSEHATMEWLDGVLP